MGSTGSNPVLSVIFFTQSIMSQLEVQRSDDWMVIKRGVEIVYRGHEAHISDWITILESFGISVKYTYGQFGEFDEDGINDGDDSMFTPSN